MSVSLSPTVLLSMSEKPPRPPFLAGSALSSQGPETSPGPVPHSWLAPVLSSQPDVIFVYQQYLFRDDCLQPPWSIHLLQISLIPRRLCVFIYLFFSISTSLGLSLISCPLLRSHLLPKAVLHDPSQGFLSFKTTPSCQSLPDLSPDDLVQELFVR